jgi:hypothetical protein
MAFFFSDHLSSFFGKSDGTSYIQKIKERIGPNFSKQSEQSLLEELKKSWTRRPADLQELEEEELLELFEIREFGEEVIKELMKGPEGPEYARAQQLTGEEFGPIQDVIHGAIYLKYTVLPVIQQYFEEKNDLRNIMIVSMSLWRSRVSPEQDKAEVFSNPTFSGIIDAASRKLAKQFNEIKELKGTPEYKTTRLGLLKAYATLLVNGPTGTLEENYYTTGDGQILKERPLIQRRNSETLEGLGFKPTPSYEEGAESYAIPDASGFIDVPLVTVPPPPPPPPPEPVEPPPPELPFLGGRKTRRRRKNKRKTKSRVKNLKKKN